MKRIKLSGKLGLLLSLALLTVLLGCASAPVTVVTSPTPVLANSGTPVGGSAGMPAGQTTVTTGNKTDKAITSPAPVAANHTAYTQLKTQAAEHWRDIAAEVANRVQIAVQARPDIAVRPIFIAQPNNRPFSVAFYNLLRSELVSRGLQVAYSQEPGSVRLEYTVQSVPFDDERLTEMPNTTSIFGNNRYSTPSDNEIIVNARLFHQNRFVAHCSAIRYINDADLPLYLDPQVADPMSESSRNVRITNR